MKDPIEDIDLFYKLRKKWNVYVDNQIFKVQSYSENNIAILGEAKSILPETYQKIINDNRIWNNFRFIFTHDRSLLKFDNKFRYAPLGMTWIKNPSIRNKTKVASMISSNKLMCEGHAYRLNWARKLQNSVDLYGRGINSIEKKEEGLDDYMFSVVIENGQYSGYFTEKIIDCFATGTIPVYHGDPSIGKIFDMNGIIALTEDFDVSTLTPEIYYSKIESVRKNFELSKDYWSMQSYIYKKYLKDLEDK